MPYQEFHTSQIRSDDVASLPAVGAFNGQVAWVDATDEMYAWDGAAWILVGPGGGGGGGAPDNAEYVVAVADATLSAERVATDTATIDADAGTAGQMKWNVIDDSIADAKLRNSAALSVIGRSANSVGDPADIAGATVGHALQVLAGPTLGFGALANDFGPEGIKYHPDREPSSGLDSSCSDNFIGGAQLTWRWGNQGSSTETEEMDTVLLTGEMVSGNNRRCRWIDAPSAVDFCATVKVSIRYQGDHLQVGIVLLETGSEATPTKLHTFGPYGSFGGFVGYHSATSYTSVNAAGASQLLESQGNAMFLAIPMYVQLRYVASSKGLSTYYSVDGMTWRLVNTVTLSAHPISIGYYCNPDNGSVVSSVRVFWFRTFTSGINGATAAQYNDGQVGE